MVFCEDLRATPSNRLRLASPSPYGHTSLFGFSSAAGITGSHSFAGPVKGMCHSNSGVDYTHNSIMFSLVSFTSCNFRSNGTKPVIFLSENYVPAFVINGDNPSFVYFSAFLSLPFFWKIYPPGVHGVF